MALSDDAIDLLAECMTSTQKTAEYLFPDRFTRVWTDLHYQIFDLLDNSDNPRKAIIAPRGIGKTTIANLLLPAKSALLVQKQYIVPTSCTSTLATLHSEGLKFELTHNETVKMLFGDVTTNLFNKEQWVIEIGGQKVCIMPRGAQQQIRGLLFHGLRPDLHLVDDLENPEEMDNEEQRRKKKEWFYDDLMKSVDNYAKPTRDNPMPWEIVVINTMLHHDSLAADLLNNPDWDTLELEICDEDLVSKIPEWWSNDDVRAEYDRHVRQNNVGGFFREFRNKPNVGGAHAVFQAENFKYFEESDHDFTGPDVDTYILIDPAKTANPKNAETAIGGISVNYKTNEIFIRDIVNGHFHVHEQMDEVFAMQIRLDASVIGIEVTGLSEFAIYPLTNEMSRRGIFVNIVELHARGGTNEKGKDARIKGLAPFYRMGLIKHNRNCCTTLEGQLLSFPFSKLKDVMDMVAYIIEILEKGSKYMLPLDVNGNELGEETAMYSPQDAEEEMNVIMNSYGRDERPRNFQRMI